MRSALILVLYLSDQLLSVTLPFSSGPFSIAMIVIGMRCVVISWGELTGIFFASTLAIFAGFAGAFLSGTSIPLFSIATVTIITGMWIVGVGLRGDNAVLIPPKEALVGVLVASGFLLLSLLGWDAMSSIQGTPTNRGAGLFFEPSHYALFVMPLWLFAFQHRAYRPWLFIALILNVIFCFSATLLVFALSALGLQVYLTAAPPKKSFHEYGRVVIVGATYLVLAYSMSSVLTVDGMPLQAYLGSRLYDLVISSEAGARNLSSLVILQGIELAQMSFSQTFGMGVGLGNFGSNDQITDQSIYRAQINTILKGGDLSLRDGGLLASKLVGELGLLVLAIPVMLVSYFLRLKTIVDHRQLAYHGALAVTLICLLFIRALPYFSAPVVLAVFSLAGVLATQGRLSEEHIKPLHLATKESES